MEKSLRIRYFEGVSKVFSSARELGANINYDDFLYDRFELADLKWTLTWI